MSYINTQHVGIKGISACVPKNLHDNLETDVFKTKEEAEKFVDSTGIRFRRMVDEHTTTSDLCFEAADKLIDELQWERNSIDCLIFVSQTPDYILPATSCILQHRLGLSIECYAMDISLGCSGWVYGLSVISNLINTGFIKRGLLLSGDVSSLMNSSTDKSTRPMFGDAGTATALEFTEGNNNMHFLLRTDGEGFEDIIIPDGGFRNVMTADSLVKHIVEDGIERSSRDLVMDGMNVFGFSLLRVPKAVKDILRYAGKEVSDIDYFTFHQANLSMNEIICKKLKLEKQQVKYSLKNYGNTSSASIPLTLVTELPKELKSKQLKHVACGFGVGLSWGVVYCETENIVCPKLIEL